MSTDTPTPRTDAVAEEGRVGRAESIEWIEAVSADFARQLERELAVAEEALTNLTKWDVREDNLGQAKQFARTTLGRLASMREKGTK